MDKNEQIQKKLEENYLKLLDDIAQMSTSDDNYAKAVAQAEKLNDMINERAKIIQAQEKMQLEDFRAQDELAFKKSTVESKRSLNTKYVLESVGKVLKTGVSVIVPMMLIAGGIELDNRGFISNKTLDRLIQDMSRWNKRGL